MFRIPQNLSAYEFNVSGSRNKKAKIESLPWKNWKTKKKIKRNQLWFALTCFELVLFALSATSWLVMVLRLSALYLKLKPGFYERFLCNNPGLSWSRPRFLEDHRMKPNNYCYYHCRMQSFGTGSVPHCIRGFPSRLPEHDIFQWILDVMNLYITKSLV